MFRYNICACYSLVCEHYAVVSQVELNVSDDSLGKMDACFIMINLVTHYTHFFCCYIRMRCIFSNGFRMRIDLKPTAH